MTTKRTLVQSNPTFLCNWRILFCISEVKPHIELQFRFRYTRFGSRRSLEYKSGSFPHLRTPGNLPQEYLNCRRNQLTVPPSRHHGGNHCHGNIWQTQFSNVKNSVGGRLWLIVAVNGSFVCKPFLSKIWSQSIGTCHSQTSHVVSLHGWHLHDAHSVEDVGAFTTYVIHPPFDSGPIGPSHPFPSWM